MVAITGHKTCEQSFKGTSHRSGGCAKSALPSEGPYFFTGTGTGITDLPSFSTTEALLVLLLDALAFFASVAITNLVINPTHRRRSNQPAARSSHAMAFAATGNDAFAYATLKRRSIVTSTKSLPIFGRVLKAPATK